MKERGIRMSILDAVEVKVFTYRTARVKPLVVLPRDACNVWQRELAALAGRGIDNHVVYEVKTKMLDPVYVWFSDFKVYIGSELIEGRW